MDRRKRRAESADHSDESPQGKHVNIQVTPLPTEMNDEKLKQAAQRMGDLVAGDLVADGSKEKKTTLVELKGDHLHGWIFSFTDAAADPGEFRYLTSGAVLCDKTMLTLTVLYNDKVSKDHTAALAAVKSFSITGAAAPAAATAIHAKSPDGTWTLLVPGNWQVADDSKSPDGNSRQISATSSDGKLTLTLFMEPADNPNGDAKTARDFYLARMKHNPMEMEHLKKGATGDVATLEYDQGPEGFKPHNLNAYVSHSGIWVDVHVSQNDFDLKTDRKTFDDLSKGLKVE